MSGRVRGAVGAAALVLVFTAGTGAASASFSAHGSVGQVYVTGVGPGARMSLFDRARRRVARGRADSLGGLLFRNVRPGTGYRVRPSGGGASSGPLTVLSAAPAPPSTRVYDQALPRARKSDT